jgi:hypothetical protein
MAIENFNETIDFWIKELEHYSFTELCRKPTPDHWSLGQMYQHLIGDAKFYIGEINACVISSEHADKDASPEGRRMLSNNAFPDAVLEGAPSNAFIPQPESKQQLLSDLVDLKREMNNAAAKISGSTSKGKTKHPGLGYFSALEWIQFADMHFRHHLRQKKRIDTFLACTSNNADVEK